MRASANSSVFRCGTHLKSPTGSWATVTAGRSPRTFPERARSRPFLCLCARFSRHEEEPGLLYPPEPLSSSSSASARLGPRGWVEPRPCPRCVPRVTARRHRVPVFFWPVLGHLCVFFGGNTTKRERRSCSFRWSCLLLRACLLCFSEPDPRSELVSPAPQYTTIHPHHHTLKRWILVHRIHTGTNAAPFDRA